MDVTEAVLAPLRERYGEPRPLRWEGEVTEQEYRERLAVLRKPAR